ncbi:MAG: hypothetical protein R2728_02385 [Chitinophagales bacterium]
MYAFQKNSLDEADGSIKIKFFKMDKKQRRSLSYFYWQNGYGAFSVNPSEINAVIAYIANQHEHHNNKTFQEEYRTILNKYNVAYDEQFVWD